MTARAKRRAAARSEANRSRAGVSPTDWAAMDRNERKQAVDRVRSCTVCGGSDGPECARCTAIHDKAVDRAGDL